MIIINFISNINFITFIVTRSFDQEQSNFWFDHLGLFPSVSSLVLTWFRQSLLPRYYHLATFNYGDMKARDRLLMLSEQYYAWKVGKSLFIIIFLLKGLLLKEGALRVCCEFSQLLRAWVWFQWSGFVEITILHCSSPMGLLHVYRASISENTSGGLLLNKDNLIYDF